MKKTIGVLFFLFTVIMLVSCGLIDKPNDSNDNPPVNDTTNEELENDKKYIIYKKALSSGYEGTYEEWLASIRGDSVELRVANGYIQWKYTKEIVWVNLISLTDLAGEDGKDGREIELSSSESSILWRYKGEENWNFLASISMVSTEKGKSAYEIAVEAGYKGTSEEWLESLKGNDGRETEFRFSEEYLQWRYKGETEWKNIVQLSEIQNNNNIYHTFKKMYPEYIKTEEEFVQDLIDGNLQKVEVKFIDSLSDEVYKSYVQLKSNTLQTIDDPQKEGFIFKGWYFEGSEIDIENYMPSKDMEIYAKWRIDNGVKLESPYSTDAGAVDIHLNYMGESGITYNSHEPFYNEVEGVTYNYGDLLPTWSAISELTKTTIREASNYSTTSLDLDFANASLMNFTSFTDTTQQIDLYFNIVNNITSMANTGKAVDLTPYINGGKMPYFKLWLEENPTIANQITIDGKIYYTPYFETYDQFEKTFIMNTQLVTLLLDGSPEYDTKTINGGINPSANVLQKGAYTPYINLDYNYPTNQTLIITKPDGTGTQQIIVKKTANIIKQQNELLNRNEGCTGKELADQFIAYLKEAYQNENNDIFKNLSDIFIGQQAAYNTDDLIALMRVFKANPGLISGDPNQEVECLIPRGTHSNRVENIVDFMSIWGVNGLDSKKDGLYFGPDGKLHDAYTSQDTYDALNYLSAIYDEGLILSDFYIKEEKVDHTKYLAKYFGGQDASNKGYALLMYDFPMTTGIYNDLSDGIGKINQVSVRGIRPIISPFTYWATGSNWTGSTQSLRDFTGKTLSRVLVSNGGLKSYSWCIPSNSDNIEGAIRIMDYAFSTNGTNILSFGSIDYWKEMDTVGDYSTPTISQGLKDMLNAVSGLDYFKFMRKYIGAAHNIGHIPNKTMLMQFSHPDTQVGYEYIFNAIATNTVIQTQYNKYAMDSDGNLVYSYDSTVPSGNWPRVEYSEYNKVYSFWLSNKCDIDAYGWVYYVVTPINEITDSMVLNLQNSSGETTWREFKAEIQVKNKSYLYILSNFLGSNYIPDEAKHE